jgi:hypothetical protein
MRVLVTGSRDWQDYQRVGSELYHMWAQSGKHVSEMTLVHGACPTGADYWASQYATLWGWNVEPHPADWDAYGKAAGPRRNCEMTDSGVDLCLAFILPSSRGTRQCADYAESKGVPVTRFTS